MATAAKTNAKPATGTRSTKAERTARRERPVRRGRDLDISFEATDQVLAQLENGGQQAISAVREFVASVDKALPGGEDGPTRAHSIIDSALSMSDRMVEVGSDAIRGIVRTAGRNYGSDATS